MKKTTTAALAIVSAFVLASCSAGPSGTSTLQPARTSTVSKEIESPVLGNAASKVEVKIFSDYQCPACQRFHSLIEGKLVKEYVDTGKVKLVHKSYPLPQHQNAEGDAVASFCALSQGKFTEFSEKMYTLEEAKANMDVSDVERLEVAKFAGVADMPTFETCLKEGWYVDRMKKDMQEGDRLGLDHTPSIYVNDKIMDFKSVEEFFAILDASVAAAK